MICHRLLPVKQQPRVLIDVNCDLVAIVQNVVKDANWKAHEMTVLNVFRTPLPLYPPHTWPCVIGVKGWGGGVLNRFKTLQIALFGLKC